MAKKHIQGTKALFEETEAVAEALAQQPEHLPRHIPIARLVPSRFNPRQTYSREALDELAQSIHKHGFIGALDGRELPDGRIELAYGSRRLLAARHAGIRSLPVVVHAWTDEQMCFVSLVENLARQDLSDADEATMVRQLRDALGLPSHRIADESGRPPDWVETRMVDADSEAMGAADADSARLDEVVASLIGDASGQLPESSIFGLDIEPGGPDGLSDDVRAGGSRHNSTGGLGESRSWIETGSTMLVLAMDALRGFQPRAVPDDEVGEALDWLARLEDQIGSFRDELTAGP